MTIYKTPGGWLFKYDFQDENFYYYIDNDRPYYSEATFIDISLEGYEVEYHVVPKAIQSLIAATQSILIENTVADCQHLVEVIEEYKRRDES